MLSSQSSKAMLLCIKLFAMSSELTNLNAVLMRLLPTLVYDSVQDYPTLHAYLENSKEYSQCILLVEGRSMQRKAFLHSTAALRDVSRCNGS